MLVVEVTVVNRVDVVAVLNSLVTTPLAMFMVVVLMNQMLSWFNDFSLVIVSLMLMVDMAIVEVVHMVSVLNGCVTTALTMLVVVIVVNMM